MTYAVLPEGANAASVQIEADIALTGALAQFGRSSIVNDVATRLTAIFAENLQNRLNATAAAASAPVVGASPSAAARPAEPFKSAELRPMDLLLGVLRGRMASRLRRWADRLDPNRG
jgi:carbon-monoxide dehydrogenase small subunit